MKHLLLVAFVSLVSILSVFAEDPKVSYPNDFRDWRHVKTEIYNEGHALYKAVGGIHHIYANGKALEGYKAGKYENGAVIVMDVLEVKEVDHAVSEGGRKSVVVMEKDSKKFSGTDGWGYEIFDPTGKERQVPPERALKCHSCHTKMKEKDFIFSTARD